MNSVLFILSLAPFYLIGAVPVGYIIAKRRGVEIIREGSGNVGATNVGRVLGKKAGMLTLFLDIAKGLIAVIAARTVSNDPAFFSCAGLAVVLGHCFSIPPLLRGGKGVATSLGAVLGLQPLMALAAIIVFGLTFGASRIVSLSSVTAVVITPVISLLAAVDDWSFYAMAGIAVVVVIRHKDNLKRLCSGTEARFSFNKEA